MRLETIVVLIVLMVAAYTARAFLYLKQTNSILDELRRCKGRWPYHAMGRGAFRGFKSVVILGADEDLIIREALLMQGVTVFARMKPCKPLVGRSILELADHGDGKGPEHLRTAAWRAACEAGAYITKHMGGLAAREGIGEDDTALPCGPGRVTHTNG